MSKKFKILEEILKKPETRKSPIPSLKGVCEVMTAENEMMYLITQEAKDTGIHLKLAERFKISKENNLICKQPKVILIENVEYQYIMFYKNEHKDKYFDVTTPVALLAANTSSRKVFL